VDDDRHATDLFAGPNGDEVIQQLVDHLCPE
jgi:hypothetical protein